MKKIIMIIITLVIGVSCAGCSIGTSEGQASVCREMMEELMVAGGDMACDKVICYDEKDYATYFEYWYDMPMMFISDGAICYVESGDNADEISILRPLSEVTYDTVKEALSGRKERQKAHFEGLVDGQAARLEHAALYESGGYLLWIVADDPQPVVERFMELTE